MNAPQYSPNAIALRMIMADHRLTQRRVAELAHVAQTTVEGWLAPTTAASHRNMPARHLAVIRAALPRKPAKRTREPMNYGGSC